VTLGSTASEGEGEESIESFHQIRFWQHWATESFDVCRKDFPSFSQLKKKTLAAAAAAGGGGGDSRENFQRGPIRSCCDVARRTVCRVKHERMHAQRRIR
jgi:hypothetical protein